MTVPTERPSWRLSLLQMLGGAAIAVALLLPLFVLAQQANNLAIAKLELELAQAKAALQPGSATPSASPPPVPQSESPSTPAATIERSSEMAQITRSLGELTRRVEGLATKPESPRPAQRDATSPTSRTDNPPSPAPPEPLPPSPPPEAAVSLTNTKIRVRYPGPCLSVAVAVADRLIELGTDPELVEGSQRGLGTARALYTGAQQLAAAVRIADELSAITPIEVVEDTSGQPLEAIQLQLVRENDCGRAEP